MIDPRIKAIEHRLKDIKRIIPVASGKGGVGKSIISTTLALILSNEGYKVGILDLDFHGASDHLILNSEIKELPEEEKGIIPPVIRGIKFMSIVYYSQDKPTPLRGTEISDALIEILAITRWNNLDFLVIDMPPGMGDQFLDVLRFLKRGEFLVIGTPSPLSINVVDKLILTLKDQNVKILGLIENMVKNQSTLKDLARKRKVKYLGKIPFIESIDTLIGDPDLLMNSQLGKNLKKVIEKIKVQE